MAVRIGWCLFVFAAARQALLHGRRWDFGGTLGLPRTLRRNRRRLESLRGGRR